LKRSAVIDRYQDRLEALYRRGASFATDRPSGT
jgi:hypothetical protein